MTTIEESMNCGPRSSLPLFDGVTGLPNRSFFLSHLSKALEDTSPEEIIAVVSLELDHFIAVVDNFGEPVADQLLGAVAGRVQRSLRSEDFLARVQHHEFAILLMNLMDLNEAESIYKKVRDAFELPFQLEEHTIETTVNMGIALRSSKNESAEILMRHAQAAGAVATEGLSNHQTPGFTRGSYVGRFEIISPLGKGGMGEVYSAYDSRLNREVAIKILADDVSHDPVALWRFKQEFRAVAALSHPNILDLHDIGTVCGRHYAVMERLRGKTLREKLLAGCIPIDLALEYAIQISEGLAAAHEKGIVHRDLKPENVFITEDNRIKILDFGLAKFTHRLEPESDKLGLITISRITQPGMILGTIGYMSPEQLLGEEVDERCDIFSFGAVLYEMLTGEPAFHRNNKIEILHAILKEEPQQFNNVPAKLKELLCKCLRKLPIERFASAQELASALKNISPSSSADS